MERDTLLSEKGKKEKSICKHTKKFMRERRLRKIMICLDLKFEVRSFIEAKGSMSRLRILKNVGKVFELSLGMFDNKLIRDD